MLMMSFQTYDREANISEHKLESDWDWVGLGVVAEWEDRIESGS